MMMNVMEYKGYHTKIEFDADSMSLRGKIEGINDFVEFEAEDISCVEEEFHAAVDDYLDFCKEVGKEPEKEYKGTFNVRISPELHRGIALFADKNGHSLNSEVEKAIKEYLDNDSSQTRAFVESVKNLTETIQMRNARYDNETTVSGSNIIDYNRVKLNYSKTESKSI